MVSGFSQRFCILTPVSLDKVSSIFFSIYIFSWFLSYNILFAREWASTFSFSFRFIWSYHVLVWFTRNWSSNIFSCFFFIRLSQYYVCDHEICESTWFNWDSFLLWFFFLVSPFIVGFFNIPYGSRSGSFNLFYYYFLVSFFYCCCVFLFILFKLPIRSITRVLILFS